jgi:hypothetical protein
VAERRQVEPKRLSRMLWGELDWIVLKGLKQDRARRYATAQGLADGVRRFLDDEPIRARPPDLRRRDRGAAEQIGDVGPQGAPPVALGLGELGQGIRAAHAVEVRVALGLLTPVRAGVPDTVAP